MFESRHHVVNRPQVTPAYQPWYSSLDPRHLYSVPELAEASNLSTDIIRGIFLECPGVLVIERPPNIRRRPKPKQIYRTLRIPGQVAIAVFKSMTNGGL